MVYHLPSGQPLPAGPPNNPQKKSSGVKTVFIVLASVVGGFVCLIILVGILGTVLSGIGNKGDNAAVAEPVPTSSGSASKAPVTATKPASTTYAIGQPLRSKKFEYVVTGYECGIPSVGQYEVTKEVAKGQFCKLAITAKNIAKRAETLAFDDFKLMAGDLEYSTDSWVNIKASDDSDSSGFYDKINPGLQVAGNIFFDVPKGLTPDRVMVNDTIFGKSATVTLKK